MSEHSALKNIRLLGLFNFLSDLRFFGPIMIIYFSHVSGSYALGGSVIAIKMISSALFEIPTGIISDRMSRVHIIGIGAMSITAATTTYALAQNFTVLAIGACLEGLSRALFSGNNDSLLWDTLKTQQRENEFHHWSGRVNAAFQFALASSAIIGGLIAVWSLRMTFVISIVPCIASAVVAIFMVEPGLQKYDERQHPLRQLIYSARFIVDNRKLRQLTIAKAIEFGAGESGPQFQPAFVAQLWPTWTLGIIKSAAHISSAIGFWWAGRLIDKLGLARTNLGGSVIVGLLGIVAFARPSPISPLIGPVQGIGHGVRSTAQTLMLHQMFTDSERSTMSSIGQFLGSLIYGLFAIFAGAIADTYGPGWALIFCQIGALSIIPIYWKLTRLQRYGYLN